MTTNFPKPLDKQVAAISGSVSQTQDGLAIVANGNNHAAISSGQFVYVKNHDTLAEGLYKATASISANGALSTSNLTADVTGGLNDLQGQVTALNSKFMTRLESTGTLSESISAGEAKNLSYTFTPPSRYVAVGVLGIVKSGAGNGQLVPSNYSIGTDGTLSITLKNVDSQARTLTGISVRVLYMKA